MTFAEKPDRRGSLRVHGRQFAADFGQFLREDLGGEDFGVLAEAQDDRKDFFFVGRIDFDRDPLLFAGNLMCRLGCESFSIARPPVPGPTRIRKRLGLPRERCRCCCQSRRPGQSPCEA